MVYNCGVRLEVVVPAERAEAVLQVAKDCNIDAWQVGHVEDHEGPQNVVEISSDLGKFTY